MLFSVTIYSLPILSILVTLLFKKKPDLILGMLVTCLIAFFITGFRDGVGFDYISYLDNLENESFGRDFWHFVLSRFALAFNAPSLLFISYSFFTIVPIFYLSKKEVNPWIIFNFLTLPWFFIESFTVIRQLASMSFSLLAYYEMRSSKNLLRFSLFALMSFMFHASSAVFLLTLITLRLFNSSINSKFIILGVLIVVSLSLESFINYLINYFPFILFYLKGYEFGITLALITFGLFIISLGRIPHADASFLIMVGLIINFTVLNIDSSLVRLSWYFYLPFIFFRWHYIFYYLRCYSIFRPMLVAIPISLFYLALFIKGADTESGFFNYNFIFF